MTHSNKPVPPGSAFVPHHAALPCLAACFLLGCGEVRQDADVTQTIAYKESVAPLLAARCVGCHSGATASGEYDLSTYTGVLGPGTDTTRNVVPGDATSRLLTKLDAAKEVTHWGHLLPKSVELKDGETAQGRRDADLKLLTAWVMIQGLAYSDGALHPAGWVYPGNRHSPSFHGGALRANKWSTTGCQECHGKELKGSSKKGGGSCYTCHAKGPTGCTVCHGNSATGSAAPPMDLSWNLTATSRGVGAHETHLKGMGPFATVKCGDCHTVPASTDAAGHLPDTAKTSSDLTAEVTFSGGATLGKITGAYDTANGGCTVYCHGAGLALPGTERKPTWTSANKMTCQSCHPAPHSNPKYGGADCSACHQQVFKQCASGSTTCYTVASGVKLAANSATLHIDGKVSLGKTDGATCFGCHGSASSYGAPAPDLKGKTETTQVSVGLHEAHLKGSSGYAGTVTCADCHKVPATLKSAGHIDSDQPAEVTFSALASSGKTKPVWDRTKATCTNVYCHFQDGGKVKSWAWTAKATPSLSCDSCHGLPPAKIGGVYTHPASTACSACHVSAYDSSTGKLDPTKHINGKVDL